MTTPRLTLDRFLPYRLSVASNAVSTRISAAYRRRFGLKIPEWRLVTILAESDRITPAVIGEKTRMDKIAVSRAASALIARGLPAGPGVATTLKAIEDAWVDAGFPRGDALDAIVADQLAAARSSQ